MEDNNLLLLINDDGTAKLAPEYNVTIYFDTEKERDDFCEKLKEMDKHRWIPCSERLPENEEEVEITYKGCGGKFYTARAFYEDGTMHTEDSMMSCLDWLSWSDWCEYCEETDDWIIPKGWLEYVSFEDTYTVIDREVIAWMPLPEPFKEEND